MIFCVEGGRVWFIFSIYLKSLISLQENPKIPWKFDSTGISSHIKILIWVNVLLKIPNKIKFDDILLINWIPFIKNRLVCMSAEQHLIIQTYLFFMRAKNETLLHENWFLPSVWQCFRGICSYLFEFQHGKPFLLQ